jgi:hypothetical protein
MGFHLINLVGGQCKHGITRLGKAYAGLRRQRCPSFSSDNGRRSETLGLPIMSVRPAFSAHPWRLVAQGALHGLEKNHLPNVTEN